MGFFDFFLNTKHWKSVKEAFSYAKNILLRKNTKNEFDEAVKALEYCSQNNDSIAQYQLYAIEYDKYKQTAKQNNQQFNLDLLKKASDSGYAPAQYDLAIHYLYGEEIEQNTFKAITLMEKAAEQGYEAACKTLIRLFRTGTKVRKSPVRAAYWLAKLENSSYCETTNLLPFTENMAVPEPKVDKEKLKPPIEFSTFNEVFKTVQQLDVIEADRKESFIINAGPGTGKTYTLIRKIENLISKQGVEASEVVVLSFTNAVVKEVKERLASFANKDDGDRALRNVDVKTFHSFAYWLLKMANQNIEDLEEWQSVNLNFNKLTYEDCMIYGSRLMKKNPQIVENWQYFIVDEIQDINHGKAQFVLSILRACVKYNVPFCFLGDSCQAIYDYLDEKNSNEVKITSEEFYKKVFDITQKQNVNLFSFDVNHRSATKIQLQSKPVREKILSEESTYFPAVVKEYREKLKEVKFSEIERFISEHHDKRICIMERSNLNTRFISSQMIKRGIEHICTLSLHRGTYPQWIGKLLGGYSNDYITREDFDKLWNKLGKDKSISDKCWKKLQKELRNPTEIVPFKFAIYALLSHNLDEVIVDNDKKTNVIVSNIHRTKGLEYEYVLIDDDFLRSRNKEIDEMKVLYVAITRSKTETFCLTDSEVLPFMKSLSWDKRHFRKEKLSEKEYRHKYVEIVNSDVALDVGPESFVVPNMDESQKVINSLKPNESIELIFDKKSELYAITAKGIRIGWMNKSFSKGIYYINKNDYPPKFDDIYIDGVFTYIGSMQDFKPYYERKLMEYSQEYGKYRIWNYLTFSGLAHAVYE